MNKYSYLFNEYMTELEARTVMFREGKKLASEEDKKELIEAWAKNDERILDKLFEEDGDNVLTQAVM